MIPIIALWQSYYYPEHVGLKIGTDDTPRYIVMETHYDNPDQKTSMLSRDFNDSGSLRRTR